MTPTPTADLVALLDRVENLVYEASRAYHDSTRWSEEPYVYGDDNGPTWQDAIDKGFTDLRDALTRAAAQPQGDQDALDAARNRPDGDWHVSDGPSGYQHRILEAGSAFDRTVCDVKESKDARLLAAAPAMFVALCRLSEYGDMSNDAQYGTLSASMVKGIADAAIDAATTPPPAELGEGDGHV